LSVRESAGLISKVMALNWWGMKMSDEDIIAAARKIRQSSEDIWKNDEDRVFDIVFYEPKTVEEISIELGINKRQVQRYLRNIKANGRYVNDKYVYSVI
jgi:predicted transcriptional regulator